MADDIDNANDLADLHLKAAIYNAQTVTGNENLTGKRHWCGEPTRGAYCSKECRTDHTKRERMSR